jgi:AraC family transcriptional regulator
MHRDARHESGGELSIGQLAIFDLRHLWVAELQHSFHTFSFVIPQVMFDELTEDVGQPQIRSLQCSITSGIEDPVILNLARALYPALEKKPAPTSILALTHLFEAATVHLAQHYGGLKAQALESISGLDAWQVRRAKEMLSDGFLGGLTSTGLSEQFDLTSFRFAIAFKKSVGVPPHRWLMERRINSAKNLLACTGQSTESIAKFCGFVDVPQFDLAFVRSVGATPDHWRRDRRN